VATTSRGDRGSSSDPGRRPTKAERKEQARLEREEIQHRMASRKRNRLAAILVGVGAAGIVAAILIVMSASGDGDSTGQGDLPGMLTTPAPWPNNVEQLGERLDQLDLPGLSEVVNHIHVPMTISVEGEPVVIPANVGFDEANGIFSPIHTHDESGTMHVEADDAAYVGTLGQVFDVWGLRFTADCLGGYCASGDAALRVFVDGEEFTGDPRTVPLEDGKAIVVTFGTEEQLPGSVTGGDAPGG